MLRRRTRHFKLAAPQQDMVLPATVAQLVEQTIRNRQVTSSNLVGGSIQKVVFPSTKGLFRKEKPLCFPIKTMSRRLLNFPKGIISP
jgi:hypothetical protein